MKFLLKRSLLIAILFTTLYSCKTEKKSTSVRKTNIIFFIADDMRPKHFNFLPEGQGMNLTPTLDKLGIANKLICHTHS
ncbi:MAG: hypothetical protein PF517_10080 [Salinivirgaceae bacterium]|nr:hypothetical protein [Salinivirgaceae bacterium]